ncbi:restriction endonuclease [Streptomyces antibioticus]|uniref:restriction endonuclease n=1 Tax=Streptomyces antibioticus TaxID=1890 RepID=UPI00340F58E6
MIHFAAHGRIPPVTVPAPRRRRFDLRATALLLVHLALLLSLGAHRRGRGGTPPRLGGDPAPPRPGRPDRLPPRPPLADTHTGTARRRGAGGSGRNSGGRPGRETTRRRHPLDHTALDPEEFERAIADLCARDGCTDVEVVGGAGDLGADVTATAIWRSSRTSVASPRTRVTRWSSI